MFPFANYAPGYTTLYWLTLVIHIVLMNFVITGTVWVAVTSLRKQAGAARDIADVFRDWLPFVLGAAITAGVAPLLFLQILHRESFYTANLLLSHRWMAVVPALLVGFYGLYLAKKPATLEKLPKAIRRAVPWVPVLCFVFIAWSFTENHVLSTAPEQWVSHYESGRMLHIEPKVYARLAMWLLGALPIGTSAVALFLVSGDREHVARCLARVAVVGLILSLAAAGLYAATETGLRTVATDSRFVPYSALAGVGLLANAAVWATVWRRGTLTGRLAKLALTSATLSVVGISALREGLRFEKLQVTGDGPPLVLQSGMIAFVLFAVINGIVIVRLILSARQELAKAD